MADSTYCYLERYLTSSDRNFPWNSGTMLIVFHHVTKLLPYLDEHHKMIRTLILLNNLAVDWNSLKYATHWKKEREMDRILTFSFIPEARRHFKVQNLSNKDKFFAKNEILSGFVILLLQILDCEGTCSSSFRKHGYANLTQMLTSIFTILGDSTPFWCTGIKDVENLLLEIEYLVNEAGDFILSCALAPIKMRNREFGAGIQGVLKKMDAFLNEKLKSHLKLLEFPEDATSRSNPLCSPFIVDSLLEDLEGLMNGLTVDEIKCQIKKLIEELAFYQTVLNDIPTLRASATRSDELRESVMQIRGVASQAEYIIKSYVMGRIPNWYLELRLHDIVEKVKLNARGLLEIKKNYDVEGININNSFSRGETYDAVRNHELVVESVVIGFEDNRTNVLLDLIGGSEELKSISIYGMPGIGKSTMAKKLYDDRAVCDHFDLRVWCVVSQTYERKNLLNDIWMSLASKLGMDKISIVEEECLGLKIYKSLCGRRYLIIMDDVWCSGVLDDMRRFFPDYRNGSRILLTSRLKDAAPTDSIFYTPPLLSELQCCDLLMMKVFTKGPCPPNLLGIANRIASKCHGLPLAVVVVAGIMANLGIEKSIWENVEANLNLYISDDHNKYMKILELSYEHLPDHLKPCFLYMGRFLDKKIPVRKVIPLWIAEGFVQKKENQSPEHVAEEYCSDLISRSLLMRVEKKSDGRTKACSIHDLLRDMCLKKAEEEKFLKHVYESSIYEQHSHLVLHTKPRDAFTTKSRATFAAQHCRSLAGNNWSLLSYVAQMPLLRVVNGFSYYFSQSEIEMISELLHLKYLSLSALKFPIELCKLVNLEYFHLNCQHPIYVPSTILKMVKLKHLCITPEAAAFEKSSDGSRTTTNLKSLSYVLIRNDEDNEILKCSPYLRKLKCSCFNTIFPDLNSLTELESLSMMFTSSPKGIELPERYFPSTIKKLTLCITGFPWEKMAIVGSLPNLRVLNLLDDAFTGEEWTTRDGEFKELRFLKLSYVSLKQWTTSYEHFPRLECLVLEYVIGLLEIPSEFGEVPTLQTIEARRCRYGIVRSAVRIEEEQRDYGNEDLNVIISNEWSKDELVQRLKRNKFDRAECVTEDDDVSETGVDQWDIELVMAGALVSRASAVKALKDADGYVNTAIMMFVKHS